MDSFAQKLTDLLNRVSAGLAAARTDGRIPDVERTKYRNAPVWEAYGKSGAGGATEVQISAWDEDARNAVLETLLGENEDLVAQCLAEGSRGFRVDEERVRDIVKRALWAWAGMAEKTRFGDQPMGLVVEACDELRGQHPAIATKMFVSGLLVPTAQVCLEPGMVMRRTEVQDVVDADEASNPYRLPLWWTCDPGWAVIELHTVGEGYNAHQRRLYRAIHVLQLIRVGSVRMTRALVDAGRLPWGYPNQLGPAKDWTPSRFVADLQAESSDDVAGQYQRYLSLVDGLLDQQGFRYQETAVGMGLRRYSEATAGIGKTPEERVSLLMASLEAVLLDAKDGGELTRKLCQRGAMIIGLTGGNAGRAYASLMESYEIRSRYVHGSTTERSPEKLSRIEMDAANCALQVVRTVLLTSAELPKETLVSRLDTAMLVPNKRMELEKVLRRISDMANDK